MAFEPDLVVRSAAGGSYSLVVQVQATPTTRIGDSREELKRYMMGMRCPLAVLITPDAIEILRDTYSDFSPASIRSVGVFETPAELARAAVAGAFAFEAAAQDWLEGLGHSSRRARLAPELRAAVEEHLLPTLADGELHAAGPRVTRATG